MVRLLIFMCIGFYIAIVSEASFGQQCLPSPPPGPFTVYGGASRYYGDVPLGISVIDFVSGYGSSTDLDVQFHTSLDRCSDPAFSILGTECILFPPTGISCYAVVSFMPTTVGNHNGTVYGDILFSYPPEFGISPVRELDTIRLNGSGILPTGIDLSVTRVSLASGRPSAQVGQSVTVDVVVAGAGISLTDSRSATVNLVAGSQVLNLSIALSSLASGSKTLQFIVTFGQADIGSPTLTVVIDPAQSIQETTRANNSAVATVNVVQAAHFMIQKKVLDPLTGLNEMNPDLISIEPSVNACGKLTQFNNQRHIVLSCVDSSNFAPVVGCSVNYSAVLGADDGGHSHTTGSRPLGIPPFGSFAVPLSGLTINYLAPEVSGEVKLNLSATGPDGLVVAISPTTFQVKSADVLLPLDTDGISFSVASHPGNGNYGTPAMQRAVKLMVANYLSYSPLVDSFFSEPMTSLESQAASLSEGGLFDYNWNGTDIFRSGPEPWLHPHCGHRNGRTVDLSLRRFIGGQGVLERAILERAARDAGLKFYVPGEGPGDAKSHWHGTL